MNTLNHYGLEIYKKPSEYSFQKDSFSKEVLNIVAENENYIILDTAHFCKIQKKSKDSSPIYSVLGKPRIYFKDCLGAEGIFYTLYTERKKRISTIESEIKAKAEDKFGWLFSDELDLSILKGDT